MRKGQSFQQMVLKKTEYPNAKNKVRPLPHIIYEHSFKMDQRPNPRPNTINS